MPQDYVIAGMFGVADTVPVASRVDVVWYGNTQYLVKYFRINANSTATGGTATTLITGVASKKFVILSMFATISCVDSAPSIAPYCDVRFESSTVPTQHTGRMRFSIVDIVNPAAATSSPTTTQGFLRHNFHESGPMFETVTGDNMQVRVYTATANSQVDVDGYGSYIEVPG